MDSKEKANQLCVELNTTWCNYGLIIFDYDWEDEWEVIEMERDSLPKNNGILVTHQLLYKVVHDEKLNVLSEACLIRNKN